MMVKKKPRSPTTAPGPGKRPTSSTSDKPLKLSGEAGWSPKGSEGSAHAILRRGGTELSIDVNYEAQKWSGVLRANENGRFAGSVSDSSGDSEDAQVSGFLYRNTSIESELLFFGRWLEGNADDYEVWILLESDEDDA